MQTHRQAHRQVAAAGQANRQRARRQIRRRVAAAGQARGALRATATRVTRIRPRRSGLQVRVHSLGVQRLRVRLHELEVQTLHVRLYGPLACATRSAAHSVACSPLRKQTAAAAAARVRTLHQSERTYARKGQALRISNLLLPLLLLILLLVLIALLLPLLLIMLVLHLLLLLLLLMLLLLLLLLRLLLLLLQLQSRVPVRSWKLGVTLGHR